MPYCVQADVEQVFGTTNVDQWADLDGDGTGQAARIAQAIAVADAQIDDIARLSPYKTPLENDSGNTPTTITDLSAKLAGLWLYEARGSQDFNPQTGMPYHRLAFMATRARRLLEAIRSGQVKLDAVLGA